MGRTSRAIGQNPSLTTYHPITPSPYASAARSAESGTVQFPAWSGRRSRLVRLGSDPRSALAVATRPGDDSRGECMATTKGQSRRRKASPSDDGPVATRAKTPQADRSSQNGTDSLTLDNEQILALYRKMNVIRFFENAAQRGFRT